MAFIEGEDLIGKVLPHLPHHVYVGPEFKPDNSYSGFKIASDLEAMARNLKEVGWSDHEIKNAHISFTLENKFDSSIRRHGLNINPLRIRERIVEDPKEDSDQTFYRTQREINKALIYAAAWHKEYYSLGSMAGRGFRRLVVLASVPLITVAAIHASQIPNINLPVESPLPESFERLLGWGVSVATTLGITKGFSIKSKRTIDERTRERAERVLGNPETPSSVTVTPDGLSRRLNS